MQGKGLGYRPGPVDNRDYALAPHLEAARKTRGSQFWYAPLVLDQGPDGSCVGHGWIHLINASPVIHRYDHEIALDVYHRAQLLDEFADTPPEEGTSVRAGGKAVKEKGYIKTFAYAKTIDEMSQWILNYGPVCIGVDWWTGMDNPNKANGFTIKPTGAVRGGHCVCVDGVNLNGLPTDYFRILNSWSASWGDRGHARILKADMQTLISDQNAAICTAVEL